MSIGMLGRRPPSNRRALALGPLLTGVVPQHPASVDYGLAFTGWQMLGNDTYGDCVAVAFANNRAELTTVLAGATEYPGLDAVLDFYRTQNPGFPEQDEGMEMQAACEALLSVGIGGHKAVAFAKVDHTDLEQVRAAIAIFGSVQVGVNVQAAQESQFDDGQPWDYVRGSRDLGGHAMHVAGYTPWVRPVTWAREIVTTSPWWQHQVEECWVVIWPEHFSSRAFQAGMDVAALAGAFKDLTGRDFPVQPEPAPAPVPVVAADAGLAAAAHRWVDGHHRTGGNAELAAALRTWLAAHKL